MAGASVPCRAGRAPELLGTDKDVHSRGGKAPTILTFIRLWAKLSIFKVIPHEDKSGHGRREGPLNYLSLDGDEITAPERRLESVFPNPFNPKTAIAINLPGSERVRLAVHDASGRLVTVLIDGVLPAGKHQQVWDGSDSRGNTVKSGVYLLRLSGENRTETQRVTLIK